MNAKLLTARRIRKLILIGQTATLLALLIFTIRNFLVVHFHEYPASALILALGFLPSLLLLPWARRLMSYILTINALVVVSLVFSLMREWALAGSFVLVPVFSLLFRDRATYIFGTVTSLITLVVLTLSDSPGPSQSATMANLFDSVTVFLELIFLIYFIIRLILRTSVKEATHLQTIRVLTRSVEARDTYTFGHSDRVATMGRMIAEYHSSRIDPTLVYESGLIHDVGKLSIPDQILSKPGRLTPEEFAVIKRHPVDGAKLCERLGMSSSLIDGVKYHHERWDGRGYPLGLSQAQIPLIGRILCVADSLDAMASRRAYREALDIDRIRQEVSDGSGTQFDPDIAALTLLHWESIAAYLEDKHRARQA